MALTWIQKLIYRSLLVAAILEKTGTPFEDWFVEAARRAWGSDFEPIRTQGRHGDLKCDGRRVSSGTIYQCYAPLRVDRQEIEKKVEVDFLGALAVWTDKMREWRIVLNDRAGLQAQAATEVEKLRDQHKGVYIDTFGPIEIEKMVLDLGLDDLGALFNVYLDSRETDLLRVTFGDIARVVEAMAGLDPQPSLRLLEAPSREKADFNCLDDEVKAWLTKGQVLVQRVESYFQDTIARGRGRAYRSATIDGVSGHEGGWFRSHANILRIR
jgi:hypothetical protein